MHNFHISYFDGFDNVSDEIFDNDQISWKLTEGSSHSVVSFFPSWMNLENKWNVFKNHPILSCLLEFSDSTAIINHKLSFSWPLIHGQAFDAVIQSIIEHIPTRYRVILKKVSFGIFRIILVSKGEENYTVESKDKGLSLSKFTRCLAIVKIIKIRHLKGHISQKNDDLKIVFMQK